MTTSLSVAFQCYDGVENKTAFVGPTSTEITFKVLQQLKQNIKLFAYTLDNVHTDWQIVLLTSIHTWSFHAS